MKYIVLGQLDNSYELPILKAKFSSYIQCGVIPFIWSQADPEQTITPHKFLYIRSEDELTEKVNLLTEDVTVQDLLRM